LRPSREPGRKTGQSYFVSSQTADRKPFFRHSRWAILFLEVLEKYRTGYLLHAYVLMPDHIHLLITPNESLEKAIQNIKGGFSYRVKKELEWQGEVWQKGFSDHRIRDERDWLEHLGYIRMNPVKARLCAESEEYPYGSHTGLLAMDAVPQRLKPPNLGVVNGGAEAPPLQRTANSALKLRSLED
jgi:putative transposase